MTPWSVQLQISLILYVCVENAIKFLASISSKIVDIIFNKATTIKFYILISTALIKDGIWTVSWTLGKCCGMHSIHSTSNHPSSIFANQHYTVLSWSFCVRFVYIEMRLMSKNTNGNVYPISNKKIQQQRFYFDSSLVFYLLFAAVLK